MAKKKLDDKNNQNDDNTKNEGDLSSNDEEPNFSDPEGFVDDISDEGISSKFSATILTYPMLLVIVLLAEIAINIVYLARN